MTSNENKYNRGAKDCLAKWIPEWNYPFVPDTPPYIVLGKSDDLSNAAGARAGQTYPLLSAQ